MIVIHLIFSQMVSKVGTDELARWLYAHTSIGDTRVSKLLRTKAVDEAKRGAPAWPKTLHGAWERLNYTRYHRSRVILVAYCPNQLYSNGLLKCARRLPAGHTGPCPSCSTPTHGSFAGKLVPHSFDYFINAQQGYKDMLTLVEFDTSLVECWAATFAQIDRDHEDETLAVDSKLGSTNARELYNDHPDYFKCDAKNRTILVYRVSDYQEPFHGSTLVGSYSTGGDNDVVVNINEKLIGKPEYCRITHIVSGGKHIPNPEARQEYDVDVYGRMMHEGFYTSVATKDGIENDVFVRVILLNYCADGPKFAADMSIYDQPNKRTLGYMLGDTCTPIKIGTVWCWALSYNPDAHVISAMASLARNERAEQLKGKPGYEKNSKAIGSKGASRITHACATVRVF